MMNYVWFSWFLIYRNSDNWNAAGFLICVFHILSCLFSYFFELLSLTPKKCFFKNILLKAVILFIKSILFPSLNRMKTIYLLNLHIASDKTSNFHAFYSPFLSIHKLFFKPRIFLQKFFLLIKTFKFSFSSQIFMNSVLFFVKSRKYER